MVMFFSNRWKNYGKYIILVALAEFHHPFVSFKDHMIWDICANAAILKIITNIF